jgi:hypothetical protein
MQQVLTLNTTTALSDASRSTRATALSAATGAAAVICHAFCSAGAYCIVADDDDGTLCRLASSSSE